ncbi:MAG: hypothetical protein UY79_C0012G0003 [Parcubacteria group bacterium GW2011_GWA2_53_21]|nr:MAG: hypothetical protein UY79_C0012G0003 [Parcubacteria group bacterium GW2011_GWA2_53_21]
MASRRVHFSRTREVRFPRRRIPCRQVHYEAQRRQRLHIEIEKTQARVLLLQMDVAERFPRATRILSRGGREANGVIGVASAEPVKRRSSGIHMHNAGRIAVIRHIGHQQKVTPNIPSKTLSLVERSFLEERRMVLRQPNRLLCALVVSHKLRQDIIVDRAHRTTLGNDVEPDRMGQLVAENVVAVKRFRNVVNLLIPVIAVEPPRNLFACDRT